MVREAITHTSIGRWYTATTTTREKLNLQIAAGQLNYALQMNTIRRSRHGCTIAHCGI